MTGTEGETAIIGLIIGNAVWPVLLGALFLTRIWKVSTATRPKQAAQAPEAVAEPVPEPRPIREAGAA